MCENERHKDWPREHSCTHRKQRHSIMWTCERVRWLITEFRGGRDSSEERFSGLFDPRRRLNAEWVEGSSASCLMRGIKPRITVRSNIFGCVWHAAHRLPLRAWLMIQVQSNSAALNGWQHWLCTQWVKKRSKTLICTYDAIAADNKVIGWLLFQEFTSNCSVSHLLPVHK